MKKIILLLCVLWTIESTAQEIDFNYPKQGVGRSVNNSRIAPLAYKIKGDYLYAMEQCQLSIYKRNGSIWDNFQTQIDIWSNCNLPDVSEIIVEDGILIVSNHKDGSVKIYTGEGANWTFQQEISGLSPSADGLGRSIAYNGQYLAIAAVDISSNTTDRVYVFEKSGSTWVQIRDFQAPANIGTHYQYGQGLQFLDNLALIVPYADINPYDGYIDVFDLSANFSKIQTLQLDNIPYAVASNENLVAVGSKFDGENPFGGPNNSRGQINIYEFVNGQGLVFRNNITNQFENRDIFGVGLSFTSRYAVISDYQTTYAYLVNGSQWTYSHTIENANPAVRVELTDGWIFLNNLSSSFADIYGLNVGSNYGSCFNESVTINPDGEGEFRWYDELTSEIPRYTGNPFNTPVHQTDETYYLEADIGVTQSPRIKININVTESQNVNFDIERNFVKINDPIVVVVPAFSIGATLDWGDGNSINTNQAGGTYSHFYNSIGSYQIKLTTRGACPESISKTVTIGDVLCEKVIPLNRSGEYFLDTFTGEIVFKWDEKCIDDINVSCIEGDVSPPTTEYVVSAVSTTFADEWDYSSYFDGKDESANAFENGIRGKWRSKGAYDYNIRNTVGSKNFNKGTFTLEVFNWERPSVTEKYNWIKRNETTKYSPNADVLEQVNALNISSVAKFGYSESVPVLTVTNASYQSVYFESFEVIEGNQTEFGFRSSGDSGQSLYGLTEEGHSGKNSLLIEKGIDLISPVLSLSEDVNSMIVQAWIKGLNDDMEIGLYSDSDELLTTSVWSTETRSGDWALYRAVIPVGDNRKFKMKFRYTGDLEVSDNSLLDDIRIQPLESEMNCFVYDPNTFRLLAAFDDQHFGMYYQYNAEGKLIRKLVETERGTKTIQETFYNYHKKR